MKCQYCGSDNISNKNYCENCGRKIKNPEETRLLRQDQIEFISQVEEPGVIYTSKSNEKSPSKPKLPYQVRRIPRIIALIIFALFFTVCLGLPVNHMAAEYTLMKDDIYYFNGGNKSFFLFNGNLKSIDDVAFDYEKSMDGTFAVFLGYTGNLYYINPDVTEIVDYNVAYFALSDSGNTIAYLVRKNNRLNLISYNIGHKTKTVIAENLPDALNYTFICISPDGRTIAYIKDYNFITYEFTTYITVNGEAPKEFGKNKYLLAISDSAEYVYYLQFESGSEKSFHAVSKTRDNYINLRRYSSHDKIYSSYDICFNRDYSEVIISTYSEVAMSKNAGDFIYITDSFSNSSYRAVTPVDIEYKSKFFKSVSATTMGIKSFEGKYFSASQYLMYLNDYGFKTVASIITTIMSNDGRYLFFLDSNLNLYKCTLKNGHIEERKEIANGHLVTTYYISDDGSKVYFLNNQNELWFIKDEQQPIKISDNVYSCCYNAKIDKVFFVKRSTYIQGGALYSYMDGGYPVLCKGIRDVFDVSNAGGNIICHTNQNLRGDKYHIYYSSDGEIFQKITEVSLW